MPVAAKPQGLVLGPAGRVLRHRDARPGIDGLLQARMGGPPADPDHRWAGTSGDGGHTGPAPQSRIVSPSQGLRCFCAQRGPDDPADARSRTPDLCVPPPERVHGGFRGALRPSDGRRSEGLPDGVGIPAPHARAAKDPGHGAGAESAGPVRRRGEIPEFPEPGPRESVLPIEELRVVPPELRADPVDQARARGGPMAFGYVRRGDGGFPIPASL